MKRSLESGLEKWLASHRRKPMILRGARQVGKSTLVRNFARQKGLNLMEINLERHLDLNRIFTSLDMSLIRSELEGLTGSSLLQPDSLLFLDEVQATPAALQALRYFYEELPDLAVIAAGSLLEFALSDHNFPMPVGRVIYRYLGPMSFEEYLEYVDASLLHYIRDVGALQILPSTAFKRIVEHLRKYSFIGGMPEAVLAFAETGSVKETSEIHRSIVNTYEDDFAKYARQGELVRLQRIFRQVPRLVGQKVKYVHYSREERSREIKAALELLIKAHICSPVVASHCSGIPLEADVIESAYKLIFLDVGLMNHICGADLSGLLNADAETFINKGQVAEQIVGQHLAWRAEGLNPPKPVYWLREGRRDNAEVDYVVSQGRNIYPIEIKAGKSGRLRSLHQFVLAKGAKKAVRFDLNQPSVHKVSVSMGTEKRPVHREFELLSLPLFAVGQLERVLGERS